MFLIFFQWQMIIFQRTVAGRSNYPCRPLDGSVFMRTCLCQAETLHLLKRISRYSGTDYCHCHTEVIYLQS